MRLAIRLGMAALIMVTLAACGGDDSKRAPTVTPTVVTPTVVATITPEATAAVTPPTGTPTATTLPSGLSAAVLPGGPITVWVYANTPITPNCDDLLASMLPLELFGSPTSREKAMCLPGNARYKFLQDSGGTFYLDSVGILPIGLPSLPSSFHDSHCESIVQHLVPGTADRATAKFVLVCDDTIPARGSAPKTLQIWVRLVQPLAPAVLPEPSRPCWETSRYLGGYTEAETVDVVCTLDY